MHSSTTYPHPQPLILIRNVQHPCASNPLLLTYLYPLKLEIELGVCWTIIHGNLLKYFMDPNIPGEATILMLFLD